jgi:spore coat polysaccharide biosynthesis protein SpsF
VKRCRKIDEIALATTANEQDDVLATLAKECGVSVFRGSENDLVDRYYQAAKKFKADIVVRICADNPCLEPAEIDKIIEYHKKGESDFSTNTNNVDGNDYPDGLGAEVFNFDTLEELWRVTKEPKHREHVHSYFYDNRDRYALKTIPCPREFRRPELKLDVNTKEELRFIRAIYEYLYPRKKDFHITDIIEWYDKVYRATDSPKR